MLLRAYYVHLAMICVFHLAKGDDIAVNITASSKCNLSIDTLKDHLKEMDQCVKEENEIESLRPMTCENLQNTINCLNAYLEKVSECYKDMIHTWNRTVQLMDDVREYLCKEDKLLEEFYGLSGPQCMKQDDVEQCGESLTTLILNPSAGNGIVQFMFLSRHNASSCGNYTAKDACVVQNLGKHEKVCGSKVADIAQGITDILKGYGHGCDDGTNSSPNVSVNASITWVLAILVTSILVLSPS